MIQKNLNAIIDEKALPRLLLKALIICVVLLFLGHQTSLGRFLLTSLSPVFESVIEFVHHDFDADIRLEEGDQPSLVLNVTALRDIPYTPHKALPAGTTVKGTKATILHSLVPVVILLTVLLVWPVESLMQRIILIFLAIPALLLVTAVMTPLQLLGLLESSFTGAAARYGYARETPTVLSWMLFTEGGARWLIPILVGIICGAAVRKFLPASKK